MDLIEPMVLRSKDEGSQEEKIKGWKEQNGRLHKWKVAIFEMKMLLCAFIRRLDTKEEKISEHEELSKRNVQKETQKKSKP